MVGNVDFLMSDREQFWRPVVSPIASRGADPDEQSSMPVVPQFLAAERRAGRQSSFASDASTGQSASVSARTGSRNWVWLLVLAVLGGLAFAILRKGAR